MSQQLAITVRPKHESRPAIAPAIKTPFEDVHKLYDAIARRAFEVFEGRGRTHGHDVDDWIKAETELLHPVHLAVAETDDAVTVRAEIPGFSVQDLKIGVDGHLVTISGKRETSEERKTKKAIYLERCSNEVFRQFSLPAEADTAKMQATLDKGVLELVMPKVGEKKTAASGQKRA